MPKSWLLQPVFRRAVGKCIFVVFKHILVDSSLNSVSSNSLLKKMLSEPLENYPRCLSSVVLFSLEK